MKKNNFNDLRTNGDHYLPQHLIKDVPGYDLLMKLTFNTCDLEIQLSLSAIFPFLFTALYMAKSQ